MIRNQANNTMRDSFRNHLVANDHVIINGCIAVRPRLRACEVRTPERLNASTKLSQHWHTSGSSGNAGYRIEIAWNGPVKLTRKRLLEKIPW
ncbi:hypothetical protein FF011L_15710 [Roseimaritima multifibrata]|uniref:Uncharacterized protein n=1 Tax=Roseimaritima multifibrata TaxID=1930274 RepID=A0A517MD61_9BACT|nr:hypothetical protein FF011L_15710 [Roseimaritima multifibrata]